MTTGIDRVRELAQIAVDARGFDLYDVERHGPVLRVTVTGSAQPPGIADLSAITRELSRALDETDPVDGKYTLEVSSPGLERLLRTPTHYAGAMGETVTVKVRGREGVQRIRGVLAGADDQGIEVRVDDDTEPVAVGYDEIDSARTVYEWGMEPPARAGDESESTNAATRRSDR
ncbi:MAG: ribosome maturation factor RimP [Acidimicrobiales bacterium]